MTVDQLLELLAKYYFAIVVSMFAFFALAEMVFPRTRHHERLSFRWFTNLAMTVSIIFIFKLIGPVVGIISALLADYLEFGLLNQLNLSIFPALLAGIVVLDLKQYLFHRLMHYFDALWQIHQVHHSDVEIDLTTGFRFHPLEAILNALASIIVIMMFGIAAEVILLRQILTYFFNFFTHGNIYLPPVLERYLKWILVTPSMHHLHHAMDKRAANHNFGVFFSFWDRMFGSFMSKHPEAETEEEAYQYGLRDYREPGKLNLGLLMLMPFKSEPASETNSSNV
jgi:sterol desaturase/sphingolipid hydroxylase (fatty acid hydroxylase superfamily)